MTTVVRNSVLNPLATCFVPSSLKTFNPNKTTSSKSVPNDSSTDENSHDQRTVEKINRPLITENIAHIRKKFAFGKRCGRKRLERKVKDSTTAVLVWEINSVISENISKVEAYKPNSDVMKAFGICNLILLAILKLLYNQWFGRDNLRLKAPTAKKEKSKEKCLCPPMFGWVIPPTFFGNPFNLKYDCCKNYVHSARSVKGNQKKVVGIRSMQQIDKRESCISEGKESVEKCSLEFQMIIRDVCNSVRDDVTTSQDQKCFKLCGHEDQLNYQKSSVWNNLVEKTWNDETLIDDGTHPLLESMLSGNSINEDEVHESIQDVEEILEKCLLGKVSHSNEVLTTAICNPPCSVWCDFLPLDAKDSFLRFLSKYQQNMNGTKIVTRLKPVGRKHMYEKSLSTDDTSKYVNLSRHWNSTSEVECIERLMLLRKDPVVQFGMNKKDRRSSHRQLKTCFLSREEKSTMWGPFDGADSLWQPLPDCVPASDCYQKQNCNRKSRNWTFKDERTSLILKQ